jgi:hypothetical protein
MTHALFSLSNIFFFQGLFLSTCIKDQFAAEAEYRLAIKHDDTLSKAFVKLGELLDARGGSSTSRCDHSVVGCGCSVGHKAHSYDAKGSTSGARPPLSVLSSRPQGTANLHTKQHPQLGRETKLVKPPKQFCRHQEPRTRQCAGPAAFQEPQPRVHSRSGIMSHSHRHESQESATSTRGFRNFTKHIRMATCTHSWTARYSVLSSEKK